MDDHRWRCSRKKPYHTHSAAQDAIKRLHRYNRRHPSRRAPHFTALTGRLKVYKCHYCSGFHIGHRASHALIEEYTSHGTS